MAVSGISLIQKLQKLFGARAVSDMMGRTTNVQTLAQGTNNPFARTFSRKYLAKNEDGVEEASRVILENMQFAFGNKNIQQMKNFEYNVDTLYNMKFPPKPAEAKVVNIGTKKQVTGEGLESLKDDLGLPDDIPPTSPLGESITKAKREDMGTGVKDVVESMFGPLGKRTDKSTDLQARAYSANIESYRRPIIRQMLLKDTRINLPKDVRESLLMKNDLQRGADPEMDPLRLLNEYYDVDFKKLDELEGIRFTAGDESKAADEFLKKGGLKPKKTKTVEDFADEGDFDPGGMAQGGRAGFSGGGITGIAKLLNFLQGKLGKKAITTADKIARPESALNREMFGEFNERVNRKILDVPPLPGGFQLSREKLLKNFPEIDEDFADQIMAMDKDLQGRMLKMLKDRRKNPDAYDKLLMEKGDTLDFQGEFDRSVRRGKNADGGIVGQLHLNQGGRVGFANGGIDYDNLIFNLQNQYNQNYRTNYPNYEQAVQANKERENILQKLSSAQYEKMKAMTNPNFRIDYDKFDDAYNQTLLEKYSNPEMQKLLEPYENRYSMAPEFINDGTGKMIKNTFTDRYGKPITRAEELSNRINQLYVSDLGSANEADYLGTIKNLQNLLESEDAKQMLKFEQSRPGYQPRTLGSQIENKLSDLKIAQRGKFGREDNRGYDELMVQTQPGYERNVTAYNRRNDNFLSNVVGGLGQPGSLDDYLTRAGDLYGLTTDQLFNYNPRKISTAGPITYNKVFNVEDPSGGIVSASEASSLGFNPMTGKLRNVPSIQERMQAAADKGLDARMGRTYAENIQAMADPRITGRDPLTGMSKSEMLPGPAGMQSLAEMNAIRDRVLEAQMNESGRTFADGKYASQDEAIADLGIERYNQLFNMGGRVGLEKGGPPNKGRRNFMKLMAGLASIPILGKFFKGAKVAKTIVPIKNASTAMPEWFPNFVDKYISNSIGKKIDADLMEFKNPDLPNIKVTRSDDGRVFVEGKNEYNEGYAIDYTPPGYELVDETTGKAVRTHGEFEAVEGRHVAVGPEDYDTDPFYVDDLDELTTIDVAEMEKYTTGKVTKTVKDALGTDTKLKKGPYDYDTAVGKAENEADVLKDADLLDEDLATGGRVGLLSGGGVLKAMLKNLAKEKGMSGSEMLAVMNYKALPSKIRNLMTEKQFQELKDARLKGVKNFRDMMQTTLNFDKSVKAGRAVDERNLGLSDLFDFMEESFRKKSVVPRNVTEKDILEMEQMIKNMELKGRKPNAKGGLAGQLKL